MTARPRPPAVDAFWHRPLWWAAGVFAFAVLLTAMDTRVVRADDAPFTSGSSVVEAEVLDANPDTGIVDVRYRAPDGTGTVEAATRVHDAAVIPETGERVALQVAATDPLAVRLAADQPSATHNVVFYAGAVVLALAFAAARFRHVRSIERLMGAGGVSFAMTGELIEPYPGGRQWRLALFPIDRGPDSRPVAVMGLVDDPGPHPESFAVEVKGLPRPHSRVVAHADDTVLWPRGRALAGVSGRRWRQGPLLLDLRRRFERRMETRTDTASSSWTRRALRVVGLVFIAGGMWLSNEEAVARGALVERSRPATATVVEIGADGDVPIATVTFPTDQGPQEATMRGIGDAMPGAPLAIRYDPTNPSFAWDRGRASPGPVGPEGLLIILGAGALVAAAFVGRGFAR